MSTAQSDTQPAPQSHKRFSTLELGLMIILAVIVSAAITFFALRAYLFPGPFEPVVLDATEQSELDNKLRRLGWQPAASSTGSASSKVLEPERYSERDEDRLVTLSQKELNGLIAGNPGLASRVVVHLDRDLASAKILVPIPEDFPIMAGQTLRVNAGLELRLDDTGKPVVALRGVSLMGVPIPNAWMGNLKNVDLVSEFGNQGFWKAFSGGVKDIQVRPGEITIELRQ